MTSDSAYPERPRSRNSHTRISRIDREAVDIVECFAQGFIKSRMGVNCAHHRFHRRFGFHGRYCFRDQFVSFRPNNMDAQDLPEFLIGHNFYEALVTAENAGLAVGGEWKLTHLHGVTLRSGLGLRHSHAADARFGVSASGYPVAINRLGRPAGQVRYRHHAFHSGDMRELWHTGDHIANRVNTRFAGPLELVHFYEFAIQRYFRALETDILRIRLAAHRHQQGLGLHILALAIGKRYAHADALVGFCDVLGFSAGFATNAGLFEIALEFF